MKSNYKAKWLAALAENQTTPSQSAEAASTQVTKIMNGQIGTSVEMKRLQSTMMEAASSAKKLVSLLDETSVCAGIDFGETVHHVDSKLSHLNLQIMARRFRDLFRIAEARIGFLSAACDDHETANAQLLMEITTMEVSSRQLQATTVESLVIGSSPTRAEMEDFSDSERSGRRMTRFGITYDDLEHDWMETKLTRNAALREHTTDESSDESDTETHEKMIVQHRNARITPPMQNNVEL